MRSVAVIYAICFLAHLCMNSGGGRAFAADDWTSEHLTSVEIRKVEQVATRIAAGNKSPADVSAGLRDDVRQLSIRETAALGMLLLDEHKVDPQP